MSLTLNREALANQIADDLASRNENYGLIEAAVGDLEGVDSALDAELKTTQEALLSTRLALNELERQAQIGNGATLDFSDIGIVPLDARATGRANPTIEGLTATNLVENGDFSDGTTGWVLMNSTGSVTENIFSVIGNGTDASAFIYQTPIFTAIGGNVVNFRGKVRVTNSVCTQIYAYIDGAGLANTALLLVNNPVENQWYTYNVNITIPDGSSGEVRLTIRNYYADAATANGKVMEVDGNYGVTAINLTSIFGAGNEPSEAECAKIFSYFDGTKSIQLPARVRSVGKNLFDKSKDAYFIYGNAVKSVIENGLIVSNYVEDAYSQIRLLCHISPLATYTFHSDIEVIKGVAIIEIKSLFDGEILVSSLTSSGSRTFIAPSDGMVYFSFFCTHSAIQLGEVYYTNIQLELGSTATTYEPHTDSTLYIADNEEVRSVPAISDQAKPINGTWQKVGNVQRYVLQESDITVLSTAFTNVDRINIKKQNDYIGYGNITYDRSTYKIGDYRSDNFYIATEDNTDNIGAVSNRISYSVYCLYVAKGTYASLTEAQADLAGTIIYYQLATPIITPLTTSGILQAKPNGTVYFEPYYEGSHQTNASSQITLPYTGTIEAVYGYDEDLVEYLLDASEYSLTGTTLTITGALENEVFFVKMSRSEPLSPEMGVNVINNAEVAEDSVTGKFYKKTFTVADGVPTFGIEEVV